MNTLLGQSLGRYHILEQLGEGGMATVYKAYDTRLERDVALKVIRKSAFGTEVLERMLKRFEREAKALGRLSHPNIVKVYDYGEYDGSPYLVMEYLPSGTLKQRLGKPMKWQEATSILLPIARALQYAHEQGVIHRDVKPSNILITRSGEPMLSDFGVAKILESEETTTLTGTGIGVGTPEYMAPEQWMGNVTPQSDLYSLGVVFYEMVTGHKPYAADTPAAILLKQATEPLPRPTKFVPDLPEAIEKILIKALALKAEDRYQNMENLVHSMEKLLTGSGVSTQSRNVQPVVQQREYGIPDTQATILEEDTQDTVLEEFATRDVVQPRPARSDGEKNKSHLPAWVWGVIAGTTAVILCGIFVGIFFVSNRMIPQALQAAESTPANAPTEYRIASTENAVDIAPSETSPIPIPTNIPPRPTNTLPPPPTSTTVPTDTAQALRGGETRTSPVDGMVQVYIPSGGGFWIDQVEVTNSMYRLCVSAGRCSQPYQDSYGFFEQYNSSNYGNYPVVYISQPMASAYCSWAGRRLPTSQEWESAARGTDGRTYPWGNTPPDGSQSNICDVNCTLAGLEHKRNASINDGYAFTSPVGALLQGRSPYGVYDMSGNVWEWTSTLQGNYAIIRGGSWQSDSTTSTATYVNNYDASNIGVWIDIGFRCAESP